MFQLHDQLNKDCLIIGKMSLSILLLMNDKNYPWFILVPEIANKREIFELSQEEQYHLIDESSILALYINKTYNPDKINIAALGNIVPQLHIHHIARFKNDGAWPSPIWGKLPAQSYNATEAELIISQTKTALRIGN